MPEVPKEGSIVHVEIHSRDPGRTKAFYGNVFGWKFQDVPEMEYTLWEAPNKPAGGLQKVRDQDPMVLNYIMSNDIDRTLARVENAGGRVIERKSVIQGQGWWALFQEPGGTVMALYQNLAKPRPARKAPSRAAAKKTSKARKK